MAMTVQPLAIPEVILLEPVLHTDARGHFFEAWNASEFAEITGHTGGFAQDNQSQSRAGVLRGLHYQLPNPQGKLIRVVTGAAFSVAIDIRRSSATFGDWVSAELSADNHCQLWIPPGFAHGFLAREDGTEMIYKVTDFYAPGCDRSIRWDDPAIGIEWPLGDLTPVLSLRDAEAPLLADAEVFD